MNERDFIDYSHEVRMSNSRMVRWCLIGIANFFLLLGFVGIITPILPTTPFLLVSAYCFARSSPRFYNWMMNHRQIGPPLRDWVSSRSIKPKIKYFAVGMLALMLSPTIIFIIPILAVKILMTAVGLAVSGYILTRPNPPNAKNSVK